MTQDPQLGYGICLVINHLHYIPQKKRLWAIPTKGVLSLPSVARPSCPSKSGFRPMALRPSLSAGLPFRVYFSILGYITAIFMPSMSKLGYHPDIT